MKKLIALFAFTLSVTLSFGHTLEDKATTQTLPASMPAIETPAPQKAKPVKEQKYSPEQKAVISGLKLSSVTK